MNRSLKTTAAALALASTLAIGACAQTQTSESTGAYVDDTAITAKVKAAILEDPALKVMQIDVTTDKDVVRLTGAVSTPQMIAQASEVAGKVSGVVAVKNDLVVK